MMLREEFSEEIVLYFDISDDGVDAITFGNALISFDALYQAINSVINPGLEGQVEFIRSDTGSIKAVLKFIQRDASTLVQAPITFIVFPILLGVFVNWITSDSIKIVVNDNSYVVEHGSEKIVLPREAAEKVKRAEANTTVRQSVRHFFAAIDADPNIRAVDFRSPTMPDTPVIPIEREQFPALRELSDLPEEKLPKQREQTHFRQQVVVLKAILEKTKSKWQFLWGGQRIAADILDDIFFEKLANHEYEFGQGDSLTVDLVVEQELNETVDAYENKRFHIIKVHSHLKGPKQHSLL